MIRYYLNWMGPINKDFIKKNGTGWSGGRIDIETGEPYGDEYTVPVMRSRNWHDLGEWLYDLESCSVLPFRTLMVSFEADTKSIIEWHTEPDQWVWDRGKLIEEL